MTSSSRLINLLEKLTEHSGKLNLTRLPVNYKNTTWEQLAVRDACIGQVMEEGHRVLLPSLSIPLFPECPGVHQP